MPHADIIDDRIVVQTIWNERERVKRIPGARYDGSLRAWHLPVSWAAGVQLKSMFGVDLSIGESLRTWALAERDHRVLPSMALRELIKPGPTTPCSPLYAFQRVGVDWLKVAGSALLADEMGTGKTIQLLVALRELGNALPAVVICPNSTKFNWQRETAKWFPEATPYVVDGSANARARVFKQAADDPTALVIINIEAVRGHSRLAPYGSIRLAACPDCGGHDPRVTAGRCEVHPKQLNQIAFRTAVVDEAHRIKDPHSKQTRACWAVGQNKTVTRRFALTGTPIANDPSELWSVMHFVDPVEYPAGSRSSFIDRYCLLSWGTYGGLDVKGINPEHREELFKFFDPRFRRMPKKLVLDQLPPKIPTTRYVELTPKQLKAYRDIETQLVTRLPDGSLLVAKDDLVAQTRLLQFSSATLESKPDGGFRLCDPSPKIDALMDIVDERAGKPFVACAEHRQLIELAAQRFDKHGVRYGLLTGGQATYDRDSTLNDFQSGKLNVLLFTLKAGGTGLTMTAADLIVFLQRSWSMIDNKQGEDRAHRIGSEIHESVQVLHIVAKDTIEEDQVVRLLEKSLRLEEITRDRQRLAAAGLPTDQLDLEEQLILESHLGGQS